MEYLKEHWIEILMLTPFIFGVSFLVYIVISREFFENK